MRFKRLQIPAYGPFTDFTLDLPKGPSDLHLIYGPNEAGKSSLLRAIRSLLFGIPGQTTDNFLHDYKVLRILAEMEDVNGNSHLFQRRKGNKNTLLDGEGNPILEADLQRLLGIVDEAYFDSMFGLGSEELRQGADDLLRGEGRLGEALFSASMGGTPVDRVIQSLEAEADSLFSGRARRQIREAVKKHSEQIRAKKDALIKPEDWEEVEHGLQKAVDRLDALKRERTDHTRRKEWLERCRSALPMVGQLTERRAKLEALPELPQLPSSFANEIREARNAWSDARREVDRLDEETARLQKRVDECRLNPEALALEASIDAAHTRLGAYRDYQQTQLSKQAEAQAKEASVRRSCQDLGITVPLEKLEGLRTTQPQFSDATEKVEQLNEATRTHTEAIRKQQDFEKELKQLRSEQTDVDPETHANLKTLLAGVSAIETIASELETRQAALTQLEREMQDLHRSLAGPPQELKASRAMTLPSRPTIERFRERFDEAERVNRELRKEKESTEKKIRELEVEIERRARQGELPCLADLENSRTFRERGWELVLQDWKGGGAKKALVEGKPLEEAYPEAVTATDTIADRLRIEAEAVAQLEELRSKLQLEQESLQSIEARLAEAEASIAVARNEWTKTWKRCHPAPASPSEMLEWRETWQEFTRQWDQWCADHEQFKTDQQRVSKMTIELADALKSDTSDFHEILEQARDRFEDLDAARVKAAGTDRRIQDTESALEDLRKELPSLAEDSEAARLEWETCREELSLTEKLSPTSQIETLRTRREMFQDFDAWQGLLGECEMLEKRITEYESKVSATSSKLRIPADGTEAQENALWQALDEAKKAQATHDDLQGRIEELSNDREAADSEATRTRSAFDTLLSKAKLTEESDLDSLLAHFEEHHALQEKIEELRDGLAGLSLGASVDEFVAKVGDEDVENLEPAIAELEERLEEVERTIDDVKSERQEWEGHRKEMDAAQDQAARHEQEAAFASSRIETDAERFVRLRVAIHLLRGQIDAFRQQNQGPFMEKASHWFAQVTGGAFSGIGTSFGDGDEPVIAGQRAGSTSEVLVPGMSEGTRDQLYLALRFAGLELHIGDHEPMPMILDDLLVHFDNTRATHALGAVAKLAERSQILLFTHHAHLVELAQAHLDDDQLTLHTQL